MPEEKQSESRRRTRQDCQGSQMRVLYKEHRVFGANAAASHLGFQHFHLLAE